MELGTVKTFFDKNPYASDDPIPLPNVSSECLSTTIDYCKFHLDLLARDDSSAVENEGKAYDDDLVKALDNDSLIQLLLVVNYLNIKDILDTLNQGVADRIQNKSMEYVSKFFRIENDSTLEEEAEARAQYQWAFEGLDPDQG
ncbi:hypothetical protein GQ457_10G015880 [Hibiscus cannabinus]